ncbi:DNA polymerase II [Pontibacterium sp. N1Y112]|uniref:DNA polymerase n=1 Tax=Pontibacterium sinense TaxID=2781979 RepID=A0A8J7JZ90_9GAMM|nr:DNA polymerase II [Pontibacterium sinense]MBE9397424.1 DNA polymerase II [Pontibacterium sinense]
MSYAASLSSVPPIQGFLLTRQQLDQAEGICLRYWVCGPEGPFSVDIPAQEAVFFIHDEQLDAARTALAGLSGWRLAKVDLQDLNQLGVSALYTTSLKSHRQAIERLQRAGIALLEEDIRHADRYLMERFIQGSVTVYQRNQQALLKPGDYVPEFRVLSIDLETTMRADKILSIGLYSDRVQLVLMTGKGEDQPGLEFVPDERRLLRRFVEVVRAEDPDIFIGWNVVGFDFRVLYQRAEALQMPLLLGRDKQPLQLHQSGQGKWYARLSGRIVLDGIDTMKGATFQFESFSLEYVSRHFLDRGKLIDHVEQRGDEIQRLYHEDKPALARYNLEDCRLVWDIFEKAQLLHYLVERARLTGLPLDKVGGSAAAFDNQYLPLMHREGYVAPEYASGQSGLDAPGGYVMDSQPGLFRQVLVLDFKSLYPSIIRTFKIDPVGMAEGLKEGADTECLVPGFNHAIFDRSNSILPGLIEGLWQARDQAKLEKNQPLSQAIKIIMNSFYGVLGSNVCRFYDQRLSSSITLRGHEILTRTKTCIEEQFDHTVIYGDTDSVFVWLGDDYPQEQADARGRELQDYLNAWWQKELKERFDLPCYLELEYETHYSRFLMPRMRHSEKGSKKRYAGLQCLSGGETRMVFKGLENVRTDWTALARDLQQELYERIFREQPWRALLKERVAAVKAGELDDQLIYRKRIRQPLAEYTRNRPPHVQAGLKAEQRYQEQGIPSPFRPGVHVEYVMTVNGPEPLEFLRSPIDYQHYIDKQVQPVADTILTFIDEDFDRLTAPQYRLF